MKARSGSIGFTIIMTLILLTGAYGRLWHFSQRPFWADEAWVADVALQQSYGQALRQTEVPVPPLFTAAIKLLNQVAPRPEVGLRLLPMICGLALMPLSWLVLRTLKVPRSYEVAGMALVASSTMLVVWSRELKQYQVEACLATLLALLVFRLRRTDRASTRLILSLGISLLTIVGPWLGYGFLFAAAPLLSTLVLLRPPRVKRTTCVVTGLAGLALLGLSTLVLLRFAAQAQGDNPGLHAFTAHWYIKPFDLGSWLRAISYFCMTSHGIIMPQYMGALSTNDLIIIAVCAFVLWSIVLIGIATWPRQSRLEMTLFTLAPWTLLLLAAIAQRYPFSAPRMMAMWAAPLVLVLGAGLVRIVRGCSLIVLSRGRPGIVAGLCVSLVPLMHMALRPQLHHRWVYQDIPALLDYLRQNAQPGETVLATIQASPAARFYQQSEAFRLICMPTAGGTCMVPDLAYRDLDAKLIREAGSRFWILNIDVQGMRPDDLLASAEMAGYTLESVAQDTSHVRTWGTAQLLRATRIR